MSVSVVIPTVGRPELERAVESALGQTMPPLEVLICNDGREALPSFDSQLVKVIETGPNRGGNAARQKGIESAKGHLVALLDDDDEWLPDHLEQETAIARELGDSKYPWIVSSRVIARFEAGGQDEIWPRKLIGPNLSPAQYVFRKDSVFGGQGFAQSSTLLFPRDLALAVPFRAELRFHQDVAWLNDVSRAFPRTRLVQVPVPTLIYNIGRTTVSSAITASASVEWALREIDPNDRRSVGDFILTHSMFAARGNGGLRSLLGTFHSGYRYGRPGIPAGVFGVLFMLREAFSSIRSSARRWVG